ncbi:methyl-accepting chemotaxis protein [Marinobacter sp. C2H3]|uniref:methyl-accepting chemotaxis protein n=1 Tax=Marinobacter sp. C2H3 TaxID=3119003 RepID=UPI00300ED190
MLSTLSLSHAVRQDRLASDQRMLWMVLAHLPVVGLLVPLGMDTQAFALVSVLAIGLLATAGWWLLKGERACSVLFAVCLMALSATMIQARLGEVEMHFHIFIGLALLIGYRDWLPLVAGAAVIAVHHFALTALQMAGATLGDLPVMLFNHGASYGMALVHAAFVVFETVVLGAMAARMAAERREAQSIIAAIQAFADTRDLLVRVDGGSRSETARHFNDLMARFGTLIDQVRGLSHTLDENAGALHRASDSTGDILTHQHQDLDQAAAAAHQLATATRYVAGGARHAAGRVSDARRAAAEGKATADQATRLTEATQSCLQVASDRVEHLTDRIRSIEAVVASINELSDQTNLLALNAAIEAARAGEHGRGFAVVAEEVRRLSRRTQEFTRDIEDTVAELGASEQAALEAIRNGLAQSEQTTHKIRETVAAFQSVDAAVVEADDLADGIAAAAEQQAAASVQISDSLDMLAGRNGDIRTNTGTVATLASALEHTIADVEALVGAYRTA